MPLPPLAAPERRLARFAAASTWAAGLTGLACALSPGAAFRLFALGGAATTSAGMRLFGVLAGAALLGVGASTRLVWLRPREERKAFHPQLVCLGAGALLSVVALLRAPGPGAGPSGLLPLEVAAGLLAVLFAASLWVFVAGAPGVNVGPVLASGPLDKAPSGRAVALGVKPAAPSATPPIAAGAQAPTGIAG